MDVPKHDAKPVPAPPTEPHHVAEEAPNPEEDDLDDLDGDCDTSDIR